MAAGGKRTGAGRKPGATNKVTRAAKEKALKGGISPLEYMLKVMRRPIPAKVGVEIKLQHEAVRMDAAKAAAPYIHPKLSSTVLTGEGGGPLKVESTGDETILDMSRRLAFVLSEGVRLAKGKKG